MLVALKGQRASGLSPADDFIRRLGLDSIETLELVLSIEETFGIEFGDRPEKLKSLSLLVGHVEALQASGGGRAGTTAQNERTA
jgi:acyl carrier protein